MTSRKNEFSLSLWDGIIPNFRETDDKETLVTDTEIEHYSLVTKPEIFVYLPSKKNSVRQAVLIIPGGGYHTIVHNWEGTDVAKWFNANGIAAMVLKYRLPHAKSNITGHKSPLLDASRAIRIIRKNASNWGIDGDNIGVMGFSAGGHIASSLGTRFMLNENSMPDEIDSISARPDFMVLIYPVISMSASFTHEGSREFLLGKDPTEELKEFYSGEKHVTEDTPPAFLIHSTDDDVVPVENSIAFYRALNNNKRDNEMHIFRHGEHGFSLANGLGSLKMWRSLCINWLRERKQKTSND